MKNMNYAEIEKIQREQSLKFKTIYMPTSSRSKVGISLDALEGKFPINGLRIPPSEDVSGWYIYSGTDAPSKANGFYKPLHALHLPNRCPLVVRLLGLPPGWRFLLAPDYEDVWFDRDMLC